MGLTLSRTELEKALSPLGYEVSEQEGDNPEIVYLAIIHPAHKGTSIEIAITLDNGSIDNLERVVRGGPEMEFFKASPSICDDEYYLLPESQQQHLSRILFGDFIKYQEFVDMSELVAVIAEKIQVQPSS